MKNKEAGLFSRELLYLVAETRAQIKQLEQIKFRSNKEDEDLGNLKRLKEVLEDQFKKRAGLEA
ncbi:MAG: hypothetical protein U9Q72_02965 [Patescibacteria group bacterium]|nr:hypothetical protein [Patescibacteria group bacterium]